MSISRSRRAKLLDYLPMVFVIVLVLVVWQIVVVGLHIPLYVLPSPYRVFIFLLGGQINWLQNGWITFYESMLGFGLSLAVGIPIALLMSSSAIIRRAVYPIVLVLQTIPKVAVAPIIFLILGFGNFPKVLITFLVAFFPIIIDTYSGLDSLELGNVQIMRSMHAKTWQIFLKARIPNALPQMFSGIKVALTLAFVGAIVAEFVESNAGLGFILLVSLQQSGLVTAFAAITVLTIITAATYGALLIVERFSIPWYNKSRAMG